MEREVVISPLQQVTDEDFNNLATFPSFSLDNLARDAITDEKAFVGFAVVQTGQTEVTVSAGRYWNNGERFYNDDDAGVEINLLTLLPQVTRKIISIVVWGQDALVDQESRAYKNPETGAVFADVAHRERRRVANIDRLAGQENVDPQPPAVNATYITVAHVLCDTTGIVSITPIEANRLVSVKGLNTRLVLVEKRLDQAGSQIDTLRTDISAVSAEVKTKAPLSMAVALGHDVARVKRALEIPDNATAWSADSFLDVSKSDPAFAGYDAYIRNGLRFGMNLDYHAFALLNNIDDRISVVDNMVSVAATAVKRISVTGKDGELALASYQLAATEMKQVTETRTEIQWQTDTGQATGRIRMLATGWQDLGDNYLDGSVDNKFLFQNLWRVNPDTGLQEVLQNVDFYPGLESVNGMHGRTDGRKQETRMWRWGIIKEVPVTSWKLVQTTVNVNGYQAAQTFINSQSGTIDSVDLFFTRKANTGDVKVLITGTKPNGEPDEGTVICSATVTAVNLKADPAGLTPTKFSFTPKQLDKGRAYAVWVVTQGSHWIATLATNKFAQGALFVKQNDVWNQSAGFVDMPFEMYFKGFANSRVVVPLATVDLAGGISFFNANYDSVVPEGCALILEGKTTGDWFKLPFAIEGSNPLDAHPTTIQLRMVMLGTTDDMPKFGIGAARSCVTVGKEGNDLTHISEIRTLPSACNTVQVILKGIDRDAAHHTLTVTVLRGAGYTTVETVDVEAAMQLIGADGGDFMRSYLFNLGASVTTYRIKIAGLTNEAGNVPTILERTDVAYVT